LVVPKSLINIGLQPLRILDSIAMLPRNRVLTHALKPSIYRPFGMTKQLGEKSFRLFRGTPLQNQELRARLRQQGKDVLSPTFTQARSLLGMTRSHALTHTQQFSRKL
jgi:hypothetical protein